MFLFSSGYVRALIQMSAVYLEFEVQSKIYDASVIILLG